MAYYGDFIGFQFGEHHFPDKENGFMLYRVSDGSRYTDPSVAQFQDTSTKIPGGDGTYYWDSFYTQRAITVQCAFDSLTEAQIRKIRQIFNGKAEDWLIFDETPFKKYRVKMQSPPQIKYLAFNEGEGKERIYKGEVTLNFISYTPYAIDNFKTTNVVVDIGQDSSEITPIGRYYWYQDGGLNFSKYAASKSEWLPSVPLLEEPLTQSQPGWYWVYNPGDIPTDCKIRVNVADAIAAGTDFRIVIRIPNENQSSTPITKMRFGQITRIDDGDYFLEIDSSTNLIYGTSVNYEKTGSLYNKFLTSGDFFKIPVSTKVPTPSNPQTYDCIAIAAMSSGSATFSTFVDYNYLYY